MAHSQRTVKPDFLSLQVSAARQYYLDLEPAPTCGITVVCGGCEHCQPDYQINRKTFRFQGLEFVAKGGGLLTLRGRKYRLRPGLVFAYGPDIPHLIVNDRHDSMVKYYVDFVGEKAERLVAHSPLSGGKAVQVSAPNQVYEIFEMLLVNGLENSRHSQAICGNLIELLLLKITEKAVAEGQDDLRALISYQRARTCIAEHYASLKNLDEVARATHINISYLCRLFRRFDHSTPYQYLLKLKMHRAAELLLRPGTLVKEVADQLQFSDPYNFSRGFKAVFGMAPEKFIQRGRRN